jgi:GTP pyrophosphokinase
VGIITTGKGVTIHGRDCQTLVSFAATPERFIEVDWNHGALSSHGAGGKGPNHTARISVIGANDPSALANLTNAIAKQEGAVANLKIVSRQEDFIEALVDVDVRDVAHLSKVIAGLRGAVGIKGVERG